MQRSAAERKARMLPEEVFQELSDLYKMFADRTRIRILYVLQNKEMCVSDIAQQLDMTQSAISHQLSTLKQGKLVKSHRDGKTIFYCHLASRAVETGQVVKAGQYIGEQGHTGYSFGDHLHFEVRQGANDINAAGYLGVQNVAGNRYYSLPTPKPDYIAMVCREIGLEEQTRQYLAEYKYADDLGRKLWQWKHGG